MPVIGSKTGGDEKLIEARKAMYRAKLSRWREMGINTSHLEELLETDIEKFKEESKNFLREHLDKHKMVEDVARDLKTIDEEVFKQIDSEGVSLESISKTCNLSENDAILSLGRLISAGKVLCTIKGDKEFYIIAPQRKEGAVEGCFPAASNAEAEERVLKVIKSKGNSAKQIVQESKLPEEQALSAIAELLNKDRIKSVKRGKGTFYTKGKA